MSRLSKKASYTNLERCRIGRRREPEELGAAASLVEVDLDGLLLLLEHLPAVVPRPPVQVEKPAVNVDYQI